MTKFLSRTKILETHCNMASVDMVSFCVHENYRVFVFNFFPADFSRSNIFSKSYELRRVDNYLSLFFSKFSVDFLTPWNLLKYEIKPGFPPWFLARSVVALRFSTVRGGFFSFYFACVCTLYSTRYLLLSVYVVINLQEDQKNIDVIVQTWWCVYLV